MSNSKIWLSLHNKAMEEALQSLTAHMVFWVDPLACMTHSLTNYVILIY
jgi:hypothetical protein